MTILITATGRTIECDAVIQATYYNVLTIHTNALSRIDVDTIFDNPAETQTLTAVEQTPVDTGNGVEYIETTKVYNGYTVLDTVQISPMFAKPGELMIWLRKEA